VYCILNENIII